MLPGNLIELANDIRKTRAESQTVEIKSAKGGCPRRLYDTLSSFSNQDQGGVILFGIDEEAGFKPNKIYDIQDLQKKVTEQCNQMEPPVRAVFTTAEFEGTTICAAEIPAMDLAQRPCYYRGKGRFGGAYVRVGDADLPMTDYELYSYEAFRKHVHDDEREIERAIPEALDSERVEKYIETRQEQRPQFAKVPREVVMEMLNLTRNHVPTLAAVMNFCVFPQGYLPQFSITAVVVPGTEIGEMDAGGARFLDNRRIEGNLAAMLEDGIVFCQRNMKASTVVNRQTGLREDRQEYPILAIREAILNALIHRDYSIHTEGTPIQLLLFSDRMEIHSPGGLYGRMTVDQLGIAKPDLRNPALAVMAEFLLGAENRYSGIPTMRRALEEAGMRPPVFENHRDEFVVKFYNQSKLGANGTELGSKGEDRLREPEFADILAYCETPRSRQEIAEFLGIQTIFYVSAKYIQPLVEQGLLRMTIPARPKSRNQRFYRA